MTEIEQIGIAYVSDNINRRQIVSKCDPISAGFNAEDESFGLLSNSV